ncbi:MAG: tetraacyldisaccharide 4'-kinase [Endomicrobium sp.]|jgi:tetraacyldisaccharide 4'-kinase|nr:tetraacyldisaccharide 4'-kinase [Endomicrobium sp.]
MNELFLYPLSLVYSILLKADRYIINRHKKLFKPVISVGNITLGGTGKTPIVIELLRLFVKNNLRPVVLTRGYFRCNKHPILLENGAVNNIDVSDVGDEALLISKTVPQSTVIVGSNRYSNVLKFKNKIIPDVFILDDGFQHWHIKRDLDIVCVNASNPFSNGKLIPAGSLREKPAALKRASIIIITNSDMISNTSLENLKKKLLNFSSTDPIETYYGDFEYKTTDLKTDFDLELLKKSEIYSLSAIGFSEGFNHSIRKSGIEIKGSISLRDHSYYNNDMIKNIVLNRKNSCFIITSKDAVKFQNIDIDILKKIAVLIVKPKFKTGEKNWEQIILKSLQFF